MQEEMQEFGTLGKLSAYFLCSEYAQSRFSGSCDLRHPVFGTMLQEIIKIVYPPFYLLLHNGGPRRKSFYKGLRLVLPFFPGPELCVVKTIETKMLYCYIF